MKLTVACDVSTTRGLSVVASGEGRGKLEEKEGSSMHNIWNLDWGQSPPQAARHRQEIST